MTSLEPFRSILEKTRAWQCLSTHGQEARKEEPESWDPVALRSKLGKVMKLIGSGAMNASPPAFAVAALAAYAVGLEYCPHGREAARDEFEEEIVVLNRAIEDMTRPIDTIRHQAKTVTVGISRPQEVMPPVMLSALEALSVLSSHIKEQDRSLLRNVSHIILGVQGRLIYKIVQAVRGASVGLRGETPWFKFANDSGAV